MLIIIRSPLLFALLLNLFFTAPIQAYDSHLNFQGMTGLYNIPNAAVIEKGMGEAQLSNLFEDHRNNEKLYATQHYQNGVNANVNVGILDGVEIAWRDVGRDFDGSSDMSFNIKWKLPFIPEEWLDLALGVQDLGGASNFYDTNYIVASKRFKDVQLTAGIGRGLSSGVPLSGAFYGVEYSPYSWLALLGEYDAADTHGGVRISSPTGWLDEGVQLSLTGLLSSTHDQLENDTYYGLSLSFPLGRNTVKATTQNSSLMVAAEAINVNTRPFVNELDKKSESVVITHGNKTDVNEESAWLRTSSQITTQWELELKELLDGHGFEGVKVGVRDSEVVVQFGNEVFNSNSLDALGLVLGELVNNTPTKFNRFTVVMQRNGLNIIAVRGGISAYKQFLYDGQSLRTDIELIRNPQDTLLNNVEWLTHATGISHFVPRITLGPDIITAVGTEVGMFDYSLALNSELELPLAAGLSFYSSYNLVMSNSDDFDTGIFRFRAKRSEVRDVYLSKTVLFSKNVAAQLQIGEIMYGMSGYHLFTQGELAWAPLDGKHQFGAIAGHYRSVEGFLDRQVAVGTYSYYQDDLDTQFKLTAGQFIEHDVGFKVESQHNFGDTRILFAYKRTEKSEDNSPTQAVSMGFSIPLTPRKDMSATSDIQFKGKANWAYALSTRVGDSHNRLIFNQATVPMQRNDLSARYFNYDRLSNPYIFANESRLREAYFTHATVLQ